jgi:predicted lipid-binding transport protein (Tim44 family)
MSQRATTATDVRGTAEHAVGRRRSSAIDPLDDATSAHGVAERGRERGPGASESEFALRFGGGFAAGMLAGGLVGVALNSLAIAMFGGFLLGLLVGVVYAARR